VGECARRGKAPEQFDFAVVGQGVRIKGLVELHFSTSSNPFNPGTANRKTTFLKIQDQGEIEWQ
jgi:hypothetical protein